MSEDGINPMLFVEDDEAPAEPVLNMAPGAQLARQRAARGWSIIEVADQLNLAPRQIQAIEADNYAALPGIAIARGFIRAYAKLMKIDATQLLATMLAGPVSANQAAPAKRALSPTHFSDNRMGAGSNYNASSKWYLVLLLIVVAIGAIAAAQHLGLLPQNLKSLLSRGGSVASALPGNSVPAPANGAAASLPLLEQGADSARIENQAAPLIVNSADSPALTLASTLPATSVAGSINPLPQPVVTNPVRDANAGITGINQLILNLHNDSWIEIKGAGKNKVASKLYRAGSTETFEISEPVQLVVGNAAGVEATLRGAPLELQSATKNNIARLNLQ